MTNENAPIILTVGQVFDASADTMRIAEKTFFYDYVNRAGVIRSIPKDIFKIIGLVNGKAERYSELKPCPFCGGKSKEVPVVNGFYIGCKHCGTSSIIYSTKQKAIAAWNTRLDTAETSKSPLVGSLYKGGILAGFIKEKPVVVTMKDLGEMSWYDAMKSCPDGQIPPTKEECMLIYINLEEINKGLVENGGEALKEDEWYWSSSEYGSSYSWYLCTDNGASQGGVSYYYKYATQYVRPVLAF